MNKNLQNYSYIFSTWCPYPAFLAFKTYDVKGFFLGCLMGQMSNSLALLASLMLVLFINPSHGNQWVRVGQNMVSFGIILDNQVVRGSG